LQAFGLHTAKKIIFYKSKIKNIKDFNNKNKFPRGRRPESFTSPGLRAMLFIARNPG